MCQQTKCTYLISNQVVLFLLHTFISCNLLSRLQTMMVLRNNVKSQASNFLGCARDAPNAQFLCSHMSCHCKNFRIPGTHIHCVYTPFFASQESRERTIEKADHLITMGGGSLYSKRTSPLGQVSRRTSRVGDTKAHRDAGSRGC